MTPCPEESTLGLLVDGTLARGARSDVLVHLDECEACRALVGVLGASGSPPRAVVADEEPSIARGAIFGRYMILDPIGKGGMGVVYAAYDPVLDRRVAIKVLRAQGEQARARLVREGKAMARLANPHVITVLDVGTAGDRDFVAMELVDGTTLGAWLRERERPWREVLDMLIDAGRGLAAAHAEGLVHRDFKPDNVLVSRSGRVLVTDFGLARLEHGGAPREAVAELDVATAGGGGGSTSTGAIIGTPAYMAPEQMTGATTDPRSDQFSFSVTCWEALGGARPFEGTTLTKMLERIRAGAMGAPVRPFPSALRRALARGLAADPDRRHPSMAALLGELERMRSRSRHVRMASIAAAIIALGLGAFAGLRTVSPQAPPLCRGAEAKWSGVWDGARADTVRGAFATAGVPYAGDAFRGVDAALGAYRSAWEAMYTDTCEATRVRGEQSEEMMQLRMECLSDRLGTARALAEVLESSPTPDTVEHATFAAQALPSLVACADEKALRERLRPPADAETAARVAALRAGSDEVGALAGAGHAADAVARGLPLAEDARALGYPPLEAQVDRMLAVAQYDTGDYAACEVTARKAVLAAAAGGDVEAEARSWLELVDVEGSKLGRFREAHDAADHARALLGRLEKPDAIEADLRYEVGFTLYREGRFAEALTEEKLALDLERRISPDSGDVGLALNAIGRVYRELGDLDACIDHHRQALALFQRVLGPDHPDVAMAMGSIGNAYLGKGRYDEALAQYRAALAIEERSLGPDHPTTTATRDDVAAAEIAKGSFDEALRTLRESVAAIERRYGENSPRLLRELDNMGVALQGKGDLAQAEDVLRRAVALAESTYGADHPDVELALVNLGDVLRARRKLDDAATAYARAVAICEKTVGEEHPHTAEDLAGLGFVKLDERRAADALPLFVRADKVAEAAQMEPVSLAKIRFGLARALWETGGDRRRAGALAEQARAALKESGERQATDVAEVDAWLAAHRAGGG